MKFECEEASFRVEFILVITMACVMLVSDFSAGGAHDRSRLELVETDKRLWRVVC
jgi:hypothetical protein